MTTTWDSSTADKLRAALNSGDPITAYDARTERRKAIGRVVRIFKNAVDLDCTCVNEMVGPWGVNRFLADGTTVFA